MVNTMLNYSECSEGQTQPFPWNHQIPTSGLSCTVPCLVYVSVFPTASAQSAIFHIHLPSLSSPLPCSFLFLHILSPSTTFRNSVIYCVYCLSSLGLLPIECTLHIGKALRLFCSLIYSSTWHRGGIQICSMNHSY